MFNFSYEIKVEIAVIISILSLLWTCVTFYLTFFRNGKLKLSPIRFYQVSTISGNLVISLPLTIYNKGAKIKVIEDLRLFINKEIPIFDWMNEIENIPPSKPASFAQAFIVEGYKAISKNLEFVSHVTDFRFIEGKYLIHIQQLNGKKWKTLNEFILTIDSPNIIKIQEPGGFFGKFGVLDLKP